MNLVIPIIVVAFIAWLLLSQRSGIKVEEASDRLKNGALLIDVRSPSEYASQHLPGSRNIPLSNLEEEIKAANWDREQDILLHCASGVRSGSAKRKLKSMGFINVSNLGSFASAKAAVDHASSD